MWKPDYFGGFNPVVRTLLNGWSISAIVTLRSGLPFTITSGTDDNMDGNTKGRPNVAVGKRENVLSTSRNRSVSRLQWFHTTAYCKVASTGCPAGAGAGDRDGTVRANSLDGPGYRNVDAAIFRDFSIYERVKFQFRDEATNVFNMVSMGQPSATLNNTRYIRRHFRSGDEYEHARHSAGRSHFVLIALFRERQTTEYCKETE